MVRYHARILRSNLTEAEKTLWKQLRGRQILSHKFRRQHPMGPFIVDFICLEKKLVIEVDGGQHVENSEDQQRTLWFKVRGYSVLRFWNNEVLNNMTGVKEAIAKQLCDPPPQSSPSRGEDAHLADMKCSEKAEPG